MANGFQPIRTGNPELDRVQQNIVNWSSQVNQSIDSTNGRISPVRRGISTGVSLTIGDDVSNVTVERETADIKLLLPNATPLEGLSVTIHNAGTHNAVIVPQNVNGRRQTVGGAASQTVASGATLTVASNGSDWRIA